MQHLDLRFELISTDAVHKERHEDIFLYNARGALPAYFAIDSSRLATLDEEGLRAVHGCYDEIILSDDKQHSTFCIKGLPWQVDGAAAATLEECCAPALDTYYEKMAHATYRMHDPAMPECEQNAIAHALAAEVPTEFSRFRASAALDKLDGVQRPPVFQASVYNDTTHYYFYGKRHEHVPGIMIMEIARQAFYAHFYRFNKHTRETVNLSILQFGSEFIDYVDSNYPTLVTVENLSVSIEKAGRETHRLRATFTQRGRTVSIVEMTGTVVGIKLFRKFRSVRPPADDLFGLIRSDMKVSVLVGDAVGRYQEALFSRISLNTLIVKLSEALPGHDDVCRFFLFGSHFGIISGTGKCNRRDERTGGGETAFHIIDWASGAEARVREFIKMDCYVVEQAGSQTG